MIKKYADFPTWKKVFEKRYANMYIDNKEFKGNISLLTAVKAKEKIVVNREGKDVTILDDNYNWLEIYPDEGNIAVSVLINDKEEIVDWYFDIAKNIALTDKGVPYIDDLYLDVMMYPSGKIDILDEDELEEALSIGDITKEDFDFAYEVAKEIVKKIDGKTKELTEFTYKYYKV